MSDKGDPVLEALELAKDINGKCSQQYEIYKAQQEYIEHAISIQKAQARVIELTRVACKKDGSISSLVLDLLNCKDALAALDEVKK